MVQRALSLVLLVGLLTSSGCALPFSGGRLEARGYEDLRPPVRRGTISVEAVVAHPTRVTRGGELDLRVERDDALRRRFEEAVDRVLRKSGLFSSVHTRGGPAGRRLAVTLYVNPRDGESLGRLYWGYFAFVTFGAVPFYEIAGDYTLVAEVWEGERRVKEYRYRETVGVVSVLFEAASALSADDPLRWFGRIELPMLLSLLYDLQRDGLL